MTYVVRRRINSHRVCCIYQDDTIQKSLSTVYFYLRLREDSSES